MVPQPTIFHFAAFCVLQLAYGEQIRVVIFATKTMMPWHPDQVQLRALKAASTSTKKSLKPGSKKKSIRLAERCEADKR